MIMAKALNTWLAVNEATAAGSMHMFVIEAEGSPDSGPMHGYDACQDWFPV